MKKSEFSLDSKNKTLEDFLKNNYLPLIKRFEDLELNFKREQEGNN